MAGLALTLFINPEHPPADPLARRVAEHVEQVRVARQAGFDGVVIGHHLSYGSAVWLPPLEILARLVPEAPGMTIGTCMLVLPLFHPVHVAQQAALLDVLSGGRLVLGVAPGWQAAEFRMVGIDYRERLSRFVESVDVIRRLWTESCVAFPGRHFDLAEISLALRPLQSPRPPLWFGGSTGRAIERAAELADTSIGDSWVPSSHLTADVVATQAAIFRRSLAALAKPVPSDFPLLRNVVVAPDRETALRDAGGFTRLVCRVQWMGMDQRVVLRTIALLAERVLPLLR